MANGAVAPVTYKRRKRNVCLSKRLKLEWHFVIKQIRATAFENNYAENAANIEFSCN